MKTKKISIYTRINGQKHWCDIKGPFNIGAAKKECKRLAMEMLKNTRIDACSVSYEREDEVLHTLYFLRNTINYNDNLKTGFYENGVWIKDIIDLGDKVKFNKGVVVYNGDRKGATDYIINKGANPSNVPGAYVTVGDNQTASVGHFGAASAGRYGTANAGDYGTASAGNGGTANAGYRGTVSAGRYGTANAGYLGTASAGINGKISIDYYDKVSDRMRTKTGYIGEDGLEPNVKYKLNDKLEFVKA